ncbi:hypothetical protein BDR05DRAFT_1004716 [Suillus weaverae]|nr:hypothetical protein BDR05DRAFT_1004716 [Suillus weaverae]
MDPSDIKKRIGRFRILIIGRANAGKTTILQRVCNTRDNPEIYNCAGEKIDPAALKASRERGEHDIENEMVFQSNPGFVFHDSRGFEAGGESEFDQVKAFITSRSKEPKLKNQLHAIWYCIPMDEASRSFTKGEIKFFSQCDTGSIPVMVLFTKFDALYDVEFAQLRKEETPWKDAKELAPKHAEESFANGPQLKFLKATAGASLVRSSCRNGVQQGRTTNRERDMHARVVLLTGGFTPLGLTLMQNLAQRGAHIIALSPKPVQDPEVEILLRSTSMRKLTCDPISHIVISITRWVTGLLLNATPSTHTQSIYKNPTDWPAQLLLGLESINTKKGFNANQKSAAAANALCELFLRKGSYKRALKLAERTIQGKPQGCSCAVHAEGSLSEATKYYTTATDVQPKHVLGAIGMAQMQIQNDSCSDHLLLQTPNPQRSVEAMVMLASLRAHLRPGVSSSYFAQEKAKAREIFNRAIKALEQDVSHTSNGHVPQHAAGYISDDLDMHVEVAQLWQEECLDRTTRVLKEALMLSEANEEVDSQLLNNMGAVQHMEGNLAEARALYEDSLTKAASLRRTKRKTYIYNKRSSFGLLGTSKPVNFYSPWALEVMMTMTCNWTLSCMEEVEL